MFGLKGFGQKPKKFNYIPRYYDPEQERREQRRRELLGDDAVSPTAKPDKEKHYIPGQIIRDSQAARRGWGKRYSSGGKQVSRIVLVAALLILFVLWYFFSK